jgi:hypothetical protein
LNLLFLPCFLAGALEAGWQLLPPVAPHFLEKPEKMLRLGRSFCQEAGDPEDREAKAEGRRTARAQENLTTSRDCAKAG